VTDNILYKIPGQLVVRAIQTLPDAVSCRDNILEVCVNDGHLAAKITFLRFHYRRLHRWFWVAKEAEEL
jgi:hypothetical protein